MSEPSNAGLPAGWAPRRIHHVAFAHEGPSVLESLQRLFGLECGAPEAGPGFNERLFPVGDGYVQTLEATGPGVVSSFLQRRGAALHHLALEVDDIDAALADLGARGTRLVDQSPRAGGNGTRIAFLHPAACGGLLVELVEADRRDSDRP